MSPDERYRAEPEYQPDAPDADVQTFDDVHAGVPTTVIHDVNTVGGWVEMDQRHAVDLEACR